MANQITSTKKLTGLRVVDEKKRKRIGKVRHFVFHPTERRVIGFVVKRPDAALMFHRKDLFVALDGVSFEGDQAVVADRADATDKGALRALGVNWDDCVLWVGMPLLTRSMEFLGYVDAVSFDVRTGAVQSVATENGAMSDALLGKRTIPAAMVEGFKLGQGAALVNTDDYRGEGIEDAPKGAILVKDQVLQVPVEGGAAAAAGKATAVVANKAKAGAAKAKPAVRAAAKKTEDAVDKGAFALGKQLGRTSGMFAAFKEEYKKAARDESKDRS